MRHQPFFLILAATLGVFGYAKLLRADTPNKPVAELMEDEAEELLKHLEGQAGGQGLVENEDIFSGKVAIKIIPMQRFSRNIPGWAYRIAEKPKIGEYRYLRFAWKAEGAKGIMLQLHDEKDWNIRFTAGIDAYHWGTKFVAPEPPTVWTVVTRDLFEEFGDRTIKGMALTVFEGSAGYFDHIYLGRTIEDLDQIDSTGQSIGPARQLKDEERERLWRELGSTDAAKAYRAFWALYAVPQQSIPFVRRYLTWAQDSKSSNQIRKWISDLDAGSFEVRENAMMQLRNHLDSAAAPLRKILNMDFASAEARLRIETILKENVGNAEQRRADDAVRILSYMKSEAAQALLKELALGDERLPVTMAAKSRLERKERREKD